MATLTSSHTTRFYLILGAIRDDKIWAHYDSPEDREWFKGFKDIVDEWLLVNQETNKLAEVLEKETLENFRPNNVLELEREMRIIYKSKHSPAAAKMVLLGRLIEEIEVKWFKSVPEVIAEAVTRRDEAA